MPIHHDFIEPTGPFGLHDFFQLSSFREFQFNCRKAELCAARECKFLVFDGTDIKERGYNSDDADGKKRFVINMSLKKDEGLGGD